jgi:hypothetical protein
MPGTHGRPLPREAFDAWAGPRGALFAASPQEVIERILWEHELLGHDRYLAQIGSFELLATEVLPVVRREIDRSTAAPDLAILGG